MRRWIRDVTSQVAAWAIIAVVGAVAVWLASLTPVIALFSPFSYLVVILLVLVVAALAAILLGRAKREWWPNTSAEPPASASEIGAQDDDATRQLARIEHNHGNLRDKFAEHEERIGVLASQLDTFERQLRRLNALADNIELQERRVAAEVIKALIARNRVSKPAKKGKTGRLWSVPDMAILEIRQKLEHLGVPSALIAARIKQAGDRVRANSINCHLEPDDNWDTGGEKQRWVVHDATLDELEHIVDRLEQVRRPQEGSQ